MKTPETPQPQWPFQLNPQQTAIKFVEQDTPQEIAQCVAFVLTTQPGELVTAPQMGLPDPTFKENGVSEDELEEVIHQWEPRATFTFSRNELKKLAQSIEIVVN